MIYLIVGLFAIAGTVGLELLLDSIGRRYEEHAHVPTFEFEENENTNEQT